MSQPFLAEIKIISWNFPPKGWAFCNGQLLPINQNQALFSILGTSFGGDGRTTFGLPDFRGRIPIHQGGSWIVGQKAGEEFHTLSQQEMPAHNHFVQVTNNPATDANPTGTTVLGKTVANSYGALANNVAMNQGTITPTGGSQAHENRQPFLVLNFIIALVGIFPSRN